MHRSTTFVVALCRATQKLHKTLTQNASPCYFDPQIKFKDVLHLSLSQLLGNDKDVVQGKGEESLFFKSFSDEEYRLTGNTGHQFERPQYSHSPECPQVEL